METGKRTVADAIADMRAWHDVWGWDEDHCVGCCCGACMRQRQHDQEIARRYTEGK